MEILIVVIAKTITIVTILIVIVIVIVIVYLHDTCIDACHTAPRHKADIIIIAVCVHEAVDQYYWLCDADNEERLTTNHSLEETAKVQLV